MRVSMILSLIAFLTCAKDQTASELDYACTINNSTMRIMFSTSSHSAWQPSTNCSLPLCSASSSNDSSSCRISSTPCYNYRGINNVNYCAPGSLCSILEPCNSITSECASNTSVCIVNSCCSPQAVCLPLSWTRLCSSEDVTHYSTITQSPTVVNATSLSSNAISTAIPVTQTSSVSGISYYVTKSGNDSNDGLNQTTSWLTVQKAANSATAGSTVYIGSGTYYETVTINVQGNAENGSITFISLATNSRPIISGNQTTVRSADGTLNLIYIQDKSYLRFVNLELSDLNATECSGVRIVGGGTNVELRNLLIHDIHGGGQSGGAMAITVYNRNQTTSRRQLIIDSCTLHDCEPAWSEALTLNGNIEQFQVTNNLVYNMNNIGIDFIGGESGMGALKTRSGVCANNTVWNIHSIYDSSAAGIYVDGGSNITVEWNEVYHSDMGIEIGAENPGIIATNMIVRQNYLHDNIKLGLAFGGYDVNRGRVTNCLFEANRLQQNDANHTGMGEIAVNYASGCTIQRNILQPNAQNLVLLADQSGGLNNTFDYNVYYPNGNGTTQNDLIFQWGNQTCNGLSAFQHTSNQELHAQVNI